MRHSAWILAGAIALVAGCNLVYPLDGYQALDPGALVQQATAQGSNTRSLMVTLPEAPHGDVLILVAASVDGTPTSVSGGGVTWTQQARSSSHVAIAIWAGLLTSPLAASTPVTVAWPASPALAQTTALVQLTEWVGPTAPGQTASAMGTGGPISTSPLIVSGDAALVFAAAATHKADIGPPTNGLIGLELLAANDTQLVTAYRLVPRAGASVTSWTYASTESWDSLLVSFTR